MKTRLGQLNNGPMPLIRYRVRFRQLPRQPSRYEDVKAKKDLSVAMGSSPIGAKTDEWSHSRRGDSAVIWGANAWLRARWGRRVNCAMRSHMA